MPEIIAVSSYPPQGEIHSSVTVGGASYTKALLEHLVAQYPEYKISVLAEALSHSESYVDQDITVERTWQRNNLKSVIELSRTLLLRNSSIIFVSLEGYMFGGLLLMLPLLISLFVCRLILRKKIVIAVHQVPSSFKSIGNLIKRYGLLFFSFFFYKLLLLSSTRIVVFENALKYQLAKNNEKSIFIPHFVPSVKLVNKQVARKKLTLPRDQKLILYFGYLAPYKGIEWLAAHFPQLTDTKLIIAGDINPNHLNNSSVVKFVSNVKEIAQKNGHILKGFIAEKDIPDLFAACDAVILPYSEFMSSSGPLSLAFAYHQPVLLSRPLEQYFNSPDILQALNESKENMNNFIFDFSTQDLQEKIQLSQNQSHIVLSEKIALKRSLDIVCTRLVEVFET